MKKMLGLVMLGTGMVSGAVAQSTPATPVTVVETMYVLPKRGMETKFEDAVKAHNMKFHPAGPFQAGLRKIEYGDKAGWYVFIYGPTTYENIDNRPAKANGHDDDWIKTVDPLVESYGNTSLWQPEQELSFGYENISKYKYYELWMVNLKKGEYYRFKELAGKLKKAYESMGKEPFVVLSTPVHTASGPDVGLLWSFNTYKDWAADPGPKEAYEKLYGSGSWQNLMDEWRDVYASYNSEIRSVVK